MTQRYPASRGRRPDLATDLARALACARAAVSLDAAGTLTLPVATTALAEMLEHLVAAAGRAKPQPVADVVCAMLERLAKTPDALEPTWTITTKTADLDTTIAEANQAGIDGERLAWALIGYEALNHLPLVWHQANKLAASGGYDADDLVGWGWQGLRVALRQYDPSQFAFSTYACTRISGNMRDGVRAESPIPKRLGTELRKLTKIEEELAVELERTPTLTEVAEKMALTWDHAQVLARCVPAASIEELAEPGYGRAPRALTDDMDVEAVATSLVLAGDVEAALAQIDPLDAQAVRLLVIDEIPVAQARAITGATARQLRQRRQRGMAHLSALLAHWAPENV